MNKKPVNLRRLSNQHNRLVTSEVNGENTGSVAKRVREDFVKGKTKEVATNLQNGQTIPHRRPMEKPRMTLREVTPKRLGSKLLDCNVSMKKKPGGFTEISIVSKDIEPKSTGQITITIKPDGNVDIYINPYDHYEEFKYTRMDKDIKECYDYREQFHKIINGQSVEDVLPGLFEKVEYPNYDDFNPNEWGKGIPETFSQEEYEEIFKKGAQAALEYAQSFQKK